MIKTLRITTIIAAVLAVIFLVLSMFFGGRSSKAIEQLLKSPSVVEKFNMDAKVDARTSQNQTSPLVAQAEAFTSYLNPPPEPEPRMPETPKPAVSPPKPIAPVTAKFTLVGTSVYEAQPELSLAFISEPGKGSRWVRQGSQVEHLTIKDVKDGFIVLQDGQRTFEIATHQKPERSLVESSSPVSSESRAGSRPIATSHESDAAATISMPAQPSIDQNTLEQFIKSVRSDIKSGIESGEIDSQNANQLLSAIGSMRISDDEAEKLQRLPKEQLSPESTDEELDSSQQPSSAEDEKLAEPKQDTLPSTPHTGRLPIEPNQARRSPKVQRPVGLPKRLQRNR